VKILLLDIETAPNLAYVWGLWKQNVNIENIVNSGYVLCWSAKWLGDKHIHFASIVTHGTKRMMRDLHKLMDSADAIVTYNGTSFDLPTVNKEFVQLGMTPPAPYKGIDLIHTVRKQFRFPSNKLDYVCKTLGLGGKVRHAGFQMWVKCMAKDSQAWKMMERYNRQDVRVLERLYKHVLPWIQTHPNIGTHTDVSCCPHCGSERFTRRGLAMTRTMSYPRYQCQKCGAWFRGAYSLKQERKERFTT
jgi:predicted RNA-binding Zn-ribbon protein involved in translation (DUF1610 family)